MRKITKSNIDDVFKAPQIDRETAELMGYELIDELFTDSSGCGLPTEPAYTVNQFIDRVTELLEEHGTLYACITNAGMFQVYVGLFTKTGTRTGRRIARATLRIETETGYKVRYHATDVIEYKNGDIILNNGGYHTNTTKRRINDHLPGHLSVSQKDFEWYVHDRNTGAIVPFYNGMTITRETIEPLPAVITINGRRWFDKVNGNTYHSVQVTTSDGDTYVHGCTYGYGDHYIQTAVTMLQKNGVHIDGTHSRMQKVCNVKIVTDVADVSNKKDLHHG